MRKLVPIRSISIPEPLTDLYGDLRDRRLLPVIAVLVVAIAAVPFLLSDPGSGAAAPPAVSSGAPAGGPARSSLAVIADHPGLRDYRRRLSGERPTNPFQQRYQPAKADGASQGVAGSTTGSESGTGTAAAAAPTATPESPSGLPASSGGSGGASGGGESPSPPDSGGTADGEPAYEVTLRAGSPDDMRLYKLTAPTPLPSVENQLLVFRGLSENSHGTVFRVSPEVSAIYGDARCTKGTDRCEQVEIDSGSPVNFVWGPDDKVFRLIVVRIQRNR
jgi:hypothetical protein